MSKELKFRYTKGHAHVSVADIGEAMTDLVDYFNSDYNARTSRVFLTPGLVVRMTRRHKPDARSRSFEYVLSMDEPNYNERAYLKRECIPNERFPVRVMGITSRGNESDGYFK